MTLGAPSITPIFATPFAVVPTGIPPDLNTALASLFLSRATEDYRDASAPREARCFRSREELFEWPDEPVAQLRRHMLRGICSAVMGVSHHTAAEFNALGLQARARFFIVHADGAIAASSAPMASWYALYCVAAPAPAAARADSGVLRVYAVRAANMFLDAANYQLRAPFAATHHIWRPVPGQMAAFPASILHEVALNRSDGSLVLVGVRVRFAHSKQAALPPW
jgi:hypothetical protein